MGGLGLGISQVFPPRVTFSGAPVALHVEDSFAEVNGTSLNGRAPDVANTPGNAWAAAVGTWTTISERARGTDYVTSVLVIDCETADGVITMPMARGGSNNGVVARYVDSSNYWYIRHSSGDSKLSIVEVTGGVETVRASVSDSTSTVVTCTVTLSGNDIAANWNAQDLSYSSAQHAAATKHGIRRQDYLDSAVAEWWKMVAA